MRLVARDKDAVALSPVDFFSVGHVIMGQVSYLVFDLIVVLVIGTNALVVKGWCLFATIVEGVLWEPFENIIAGAFVAVVLWFRRAPALQYTRHDLRAALGTSAWALLWECTGSTRPSLPGAG